jgi:hypothetical protein
MAMQIGATGMAMLRVVGGSDGLVEELLAPGRVLAAEVVSVHEGRAILSFGRGVRLEVSLQVGLEEGQRIRVQVEPRDNPALIALKLLPPDPPQALMSQQQAAMPQVVWIPIPLPDGGQGWAQLRVEEEPSRRQRGEEKAVRQVRLWWETPALGAVQVSLESAGPHLAALFTAAEAESRTAILEGLAGLKERLAAAGFAEPLVGCRAPRPGESLAPPAGGEYRLDRRL